ncbi:hypothetical protein G5B31_12765 [Rhodobacter sp. SGA-6-6]|uniref:hypothetical protein n=1 Tax=Rhodobacter sp. SGA-6-6 TaxID=2710882 RepID=UPI0013EB9F5A|nr:hypothetical protein [Rhodobacter sp. SGA-6-6]NGM46407.1 hypothetical protein [Rhodobacter sp. SGA-6-6]
MTDKTLTIYSFAEARVFTAPSMPGECILAIRSGTETTHYAMSIEDLAGLAERLRQDAMLLKA